MSTSIKPASEYARAEQKNRASVEAQYRDKVNAFITSKIMPTIEDMVANPAKYTFSGSVSKEIPGDLLPAPRCVAVAQEILSPLGYEVKESHDGGGMYSTLLVSWGTKRPASTNPLASAVKSIEEGLEAIGNDDGYSEATDRAKAMIGDLLALVTPKQRAAFLAKYDDVVDAGTKTDKTD